MSREGGNIREIIDHVHGMRFVLEHLTLHSGPGRRLKNELKLEFEAGAIEQMLQEVTDTLTHLDSPQSLRRDLVEIQLHHAHDISGTVERLQTASVRDDIELFEVKFFSLTAMKLRRMLTSADFPHVSLPDLQAVIRLLDPDGKELPEFYIYDGYSPELTQARAELVAFHRQGAASETIESLRLRCTELEDGVRRELSARLRPYTQALTQALGQIAKLDLLLAKAKLAVDLDLVRPTIGAGETEYRGIFHPEIRHGLEAQGRSYQEVDIRLRQGVTLITGANMAGKSVLLQCVSLAQHMVQLGLFVPARAARIAPVEAVLTSIGDGQDLLGGLSSFGAEMVRLDHIVRQVKHGLRPLVLLDELARTTNPVEGRAIVCGVIDFLNAHGVTSVVTTHYGGVNVACHRLKVRGFQPDRVQGALGVRRINEYIDYSLVEDTDGEVPHEALNIARLMGVDRDLLARCASHLED